MRQLTRLTLVVVAALALVPAAAQASPAFYATPIFGITSVPDGRLLVADAGRGIVDGDSGALVAALPGAQDVAAAGDGELWAVTSGPEGVAGVQKLYRIDASGTAVPVADLGQFETKRNPHPFVLESNPFDVANLGGDEALVADAAGNDLITVNKHGKPKLVAVFPDELASTANAKALFGCPAGPPDICGLPPMIPGEGVPTSIAIGPDGAYYVGELKGFPAPVGESRIWRIEPNARNADCGRSPLCSVAVDGLTSIIDLTFGPDGRLYVAQLDDASWFALELGAPAGGSVRACTLATGSCSTIVSGLPILTSIAFRADASLWGATWALVPGLADVVQLTP